MATKSSLEGNKTPLTVTSTYSSSEMLEWGLTLMWRKGFRFGQSEKTFLFSIRNSDITVWFRCIAVELIVKDCNKEEEEEPRGIMSKRKKNLKTQEVEEHSIRQEWKEEKKNRGLNSKGRQEGYDIFLGSLLYILFLFSWVFTFLFWICHFEWIL
jgi:hypothetical protein